MRVYLTKLEKKWTKTRFPDTTEAETEVHRKRVLWSAFGGSPRFDEEFVRAADAATLELMKRHDDLLLSIADYVEGPLLLMPVVSSTYLLIWRKALHLEFTKKPEGYLEGVPSHAWRYNSPYDYTDDLLMDFLIEEFPEHEDKIRAKFADRVSEADDSDGSDSDDLDEDGDKAGLRGCGACALEEDTCLRPHI